MPRTPRASSGTTSLPFDDYERAMWAGQAGAYQDSVAALCAGTAPALLDAAGIIDPPAAGSPAEPSNPPSLGNPPDLNNPPDHSNPPATGNPPDPSNPPATGSPAEPSNPPSLGNPPDPSNPPASGSPAEIGHSAAGASLAAAVDPGRAASPAKPGDFGDMLGTGGSAGLGERSGTGRASGTGGTSRSGAVGGTSDRPGRSAAGGGGSGVRLLDVGTGSGTVALLASARGARVTGVDAEPSMVELATRRVPGAGFHRAVLPVLPFPDGTFDAAVANFVINHVGDPVAAVAEMGRVVRPGGRVVLTIWPQPLPEAQRLWDRIFDAAGVVRPTDLPRLDPECDFDRTPEGVSALFAAAGLTPVRSEAVAWVQRISAEAWWNGPAAGIGAKGHLLRRQDPATLDRVRREYDVRTAPYRSADGLLALPTAAVLGVATVP